MFSFFKEYQGLSEREIKNWWLECTNRFLYSCWQKIRNKIIKRQKKPTKMTKETEKQEGTKLKKISLRIMTIDAEKWKHIWWKWSENAPSDEERWGTMMMINQHFWDDRELWGRQEDRPLSKVSHVDYSKETLARWM